MIGSYGTLGIICEATIRLLPLPEKMQTQLIFFNSLDKANSFVDQVFESSLLPAAVELINHTAYNRLLCEETVNDSFRGYIAALAYEGTRESVARMAQEMPEYAFKHDVIDKIDFQESEHIGFWQKMSNMAARLPDNFPCLFTSRISYPLSHRSSMMHMVDETMSQFGIEHAMVTHAGSGVCFTTMLLDDTDSTSKKKAEEAIVIFRNRCGEIGGRVILEKLPVAAKSDIPVWGETRSDFTVMRRIKEQLDPAGIMSPGRYVGGL